MDYLPSVYSSWVEEAGEERPTRCHTTIAQNLHSRFNFVVCLKKRIVGYVSLLFTRDQRKFLMSAERVARELQGRGIGARIVQFVAKFVRDKQVHLSPFSALHHPPSLCPSLPPIPPGPRGGPPAAPHLL